MHQPGLFRLDRVLQINVTRMSVCHRQMAYRDGSSLEITPRVGLGESISESKIIQNFSLKVVDLFEENVPGPAHRHTNSMTAN